MKPAEVAHGYMFIGLMLNILLFGIMIAQVYVYHTSYKKDSWGLKCFVSYLFIADLVNAIFCFVYLYRTLIIDFGDAEALGVADWIFATEPALTAIIASSVQLFFARRIWLLTKNWALVALVVVTSLTSGICGIMTAFEVGQTPNFVDFRNFEAVVSAWLVSTVACDAFITFILVHTLRKHKTGFQRSDMMVDRIIRITVQTGFITMIIAALDLAFYLAVPSGLHLLFSFPLSKLYTNSLMSSLNSRHKVFYGSTTQPSTMDGINTSSAMVPPSQRVHNSKQQDMISFGAPARPEVFVHVEHHELRDVHEQLGIQETGNEEQSFRSSLEKGDEGKWPAV